MAFTRWGCTFDGPWPNTDILKPRSGIWVVWRQTGRQWEVIEVGESRNVRKSLVGRAEALSLQHAGGGSIHYSATYTAKLPAKERRELAQRIERIARPQ